MGMSLDNKRARRLVLTASFASRFWYFKTDFFAFRTCLEIIDFQDLFFSRNVRVKAAFQASIHSVISSIMSRVTTFNSNLLSIALHNPKKQDIDYQIKVIIKNSEPCNSPNRSSNTSEISPPSFVRNTSKRILTAKDS